MMLNPPPTWTDEDPASMSPPRSGSAGIHISRSTSASPANTRRFGGWFTWPVYHVLGEGRWGRDGTNPLAQGAELVGQRGQVQAVGVDDGDGAGRESLQAVAGTCARTGHGVARVAVPAARRGQPARLPPVGPRRR